jgi:NAD(P)-dependent dehydrogenase (short-subunit alcohol dehydrogenase family)
VVRLEGRVVIVTGAAQGLGFEVARRLAEEGARLVLTDIKEDAGLKAAEALRARFIHQNVASESDWVRIIADVDRTEGSLHALVNNAGIEGDPAAAKDPEHAVLFLVSEESRYITGQGLAVDGGFTLAN